jgi:MoaD family protein
MTKSITIEVRIFATLREIIGLKKFPMTLQRGITIREFLRLLEEHFDKGEDFVETVMDLDNPNRVRDYVKFMINGRILPHDQILDFTIETDGDVLAIFPPIGGG